MLYVSPPASAVFQTLHAELLEQSGAPAAEVRAAFERAVEMDASSARALEGLADASAATDPEGSRDLLQRAVAQTPGDPAIRRKLAALLVSAGQPDQAATQLEAAYEADPFDPATSTALAALLLEQGGAPERPLQLAQRAARLGGGAQALEVLGRAYERSGDAASAVAAVERAEALRQKAFDQ